MATVTALRAHGRRLVEVEVDGGVWRTLPSEAVVAAGLARGVELDRPRARSLRRELRRLEAIGVAARSLRRRDLSERALEERLGRAGIAPAERRGALDSLTRAGVVSDERLARARAGVLAERGEGDGAIRWRLEGEGVAAELVERALGELEPEAARAGRIVARRGATDATARVLARRGFGWDAIEAALEGAAGQTP